MATGGFDEEDDLDDSFVDGLAPVDSTSAIPVGDVADEEAWDENDFDEEFDEDFDAEPDEDLQKFEQELNADDATSCSANDEEFDEDFE